MSEWNPNYETREDETNNKPDRENRIHEIEKIAFDCITDYQPGDAMAQGRRIHQNAEYP